MNKVTAIGPDLYRRAKRALRRPFHLELPHRHALAQVVRGYETGTGVDQIFVETATEALHRGERRARRAPEPPSISLGHAA